MKSLFALLFLVIALSGCQKDQVPVENQFSFTIDSVKTACPGPFSCTGPPFFQFSGLFSDGQIVIDLWDFPETPGEYIIDPAIPNIDRQITIWKGNQIYATWGGVFGNEQGSGKIIMEEVSDHHIRGRFECVFLPTVWHPATNGSGSFQLARDN